MLRYEWLYLIKEILKMINYYYNKRVKALLLCCSVVFLLAGCASTNISPEKMLNDTKQFSLPYAPQANKALVYFIYRADRPNVYGDRIGLYYANSTADKFERSTNRAAKILDIFTLGLTEEDPSAEKIAIGELEPGQFRIAQLNPGYYELKRILVNPSPIIQQTEQIKYVKLEPGNTYFIELFGDSFYNRYYNSSTHNIYIKEEKDPLAGKYILFKNFREARE